MLLARQSTTVPKVSKVNALIPVTGIEWRFSLLRLRHAELREDLLLLGVFLVHATLALDGACVDIRPVVLLHFRFPVLGLRHLAEHAVPVGDLGAVEALRR